MCKKRAIIWTEGNESNHINEKQDVKFRYDVKLNGNDFPEYDIFNALNDMEKAGLINLKKVFNMLKAKYGITISDSIDIYKEIITGKENWKILPNDKE